MNAGTSLRADTLPVASLMHPLKEARTPFLPYVGTSHINGGSGANMKGSCGIQDRTPKTQWLW